MNNDVLDEPLEEPLNQGEELLNSEMAYVEMKKSISYLCIMFTVSGLTLFSGYEILSLLGGMFLVVFFFLFIISLVTCMFYTFLSVMKREENTKEKWFPFLLFAILIGMMFIFDYFIIAPLGNLEL